MYSREDLDTEGLLDFRVFLCHVWAYLGLPRPTAVQLDIAYWLQHGPKRGILQAFRGVGKSWITVAFVLWCLLLDPQLNIMVVSANENAATDFTKFCKQLIDGMPLLQHLRPGIDQLDRTDAFDVGPARPDKNPSVKSVGITGQLTGSRADIIVGDDIEVPKNSMTFVQRERISELVKEFTAVLKPNETSRIIYLGTPQVEQTLYQRLQKRGYETRIWTSRVPFNVSLYAGRLAPFVQRMIDRGYAVHTPVEPTRFPSEILDEALADYGQAGFNLQFQLDTTASDIEKHPLKLRDLIIHDVHPDMGHIQMVWGASPPLVIQGLECGGFDGDCYHRAAWSSTEMAKYQSIVMAIDPSGKGNDETAYAIVGYLSGMLTLLDIGGYTDGFGEPTLKALAGKSLRWGVNHLIAEENYGGGMFVQLLKPYLIQATQTDNKENIKRAAGTFDEEWDGWSSTQKELRILDTLEPIVQNHKLIVSRAVIENDIKQQREKEKYSFVQQFTRMARIKGCLPNEDRLDVLAQACSYFTVKMNKDSNRALQQHRSALLDKDLKNFAAKSFFGVGTPRRSLSRFQ